MVKFEYPSYFTQPLTYVMLWWPGARDPPSAKYATALSR
jgi:hypothetical protein